MKSNPLCVLLVLITACASGHAHEARGDSPKWVVAWKGAERPKARPGRVVPATADYSVTYAAEEMARHMGDVLDSDVQIAPWEEATGENLFLVTEQQYAPEDVRKALDGKRRDAFDPRRYADQPDLYPFYEGRRHVPDGSIRRDCTGRQRRGQRRVGVVRRCGARQDRRPLSCMPIAKQTPVSCKSITTPSKKGLTAENYPGSITAVVNPEAEPCHS